MEDNYSPRDYGNETGLLWLCNYLYSEKVEIYSGFECYGELFRDWFERKVRWYKTGNNKEMFNFAPFLKHLRKKSLQGYLLQDRFERGR